MLVETTEMNDVCEEATGYTYMYCAILAASQTLVELFTCTLDTVQLSDFVTMNKPVNTIFLST